jgi:hypothetical protein
MKDRIYEETYNGQSFRFNLKGKFFDHQYNPIEPTLNSEGKYIIKGELVSDVLEYVNVNVKEK